ncbi:MAG: hypothetical protein DRJ44_01560 [Thermoprotei archaeon]|nr:hypothetical protein [Thermoproteales archaeon]RLE77638.1 MAG: hypothetical protein DRJ44_01560 [Thermoprotei archaeon]
MVLAFKVFEVVEEMNFATIASKLKNYKMVEIEEINGREVETGFEIVSLEERDGKLVGNVIESFIVSLSYKGEEFRAPVSVSTLFEFYRYRDRILLIIAAKKPRANRIASIFSTILSARKAAILEAQIPAETLKALHEERPGSTKVVFFDGVKLPGVDKLSLYGEQLADTTLYSEYLKLGKVWYVVFEAEEGIVIGVTRNCVVTFFSKIDIDSALDYIREKIIPLTVKP